MESPDGEPGLAGPRARALPPLPTLPDAGRGTGGSVCPSARPRQKRDPVRRAASALHVLAPPCGMSTARLSAQLSSSPSTLPVRQAFLTSAHSSEPFAPVGPLPPLFPKFRPFSRLFKTQGQVRSA